MKLSRRSLFPKDVQLLGQMRNEQIQQSIAVNVAQGDPHVRLCLSQAVVSEAPEQGFLLERAVALVDPEVVRLAVVGDKDVRPTVAVEIGADDTQARPCQLAKTRFQRHVLETNRLRGRAGNAAQVVEKTRNGA